MQEKNTTTNQKKIFSFFSTANISYTIIILITIAVVFNNFFIRNIYAENYANDSAVYQIIGGDQLEKLEEEKSYYQETFKPLETTNSPLDFAVKSLPSPENSTTTEEELLAVDLGTLTQEGTAIIRPNIVTSAPAGTPRGKIITYTVESNDTVSSIANRFGVSINTILWENKLSSRSLIKPGDQLKILPISGISHVVKKGETLDSIAKKYKIDAEEIRKFNNLPDASFISISQNLVIPGGKINYAPVATLASAGFKQLKPSSGQASNNGFLWPTVSQRITQYYSWRHHAIDVGGKLGSPIYASLGGKIERSGWTTGYGNNIIINHGGGKKTLYAHMTQLLVKKGDEVFAGQVIGLLGSTGWSTGPHLHFEIIINGSKVNPLNQL